MDNNHRWYRDDYQNSVYGGLYNKKTRGGKGRKILTYISLVLIASVISGVVVSNVMNKRFSSEIARVEQLALDAANDAVVKLAKESTVNSDESMVANATLNKGSTLVDMAKKAGPSIVGIRMVTENPVISFFGRTSQQQKAEGSGIIISKDGYIVTNYHVVEHADPREKTSKNTVLEVFLSDDRQAKAKFIGGDAQNDLAVIKIELDKLTVAELGDSSKLEVGESAVAIGNPLGLEFAGSVTAGVISALNRKVETDDKIMNLIQTDAAINPGNSGGALVNWQGQVIGINTIKIAVAGVEGLGFAIPINDAKPIIEQLIQHGYVKGRPSLGISGSEITETLARWYDIPVGLFIQEVQPGGGADKAGIRGGDIIVSIAGESIINMKDLAQVIKDYKAGDTVDIEIIRDNKKKKSSVTFSEEY